MIGSNNTRLIAAMVVALIGVGAVVWTGIRLFGGQPSVASALPQLAPEDVDGPRFYEDDPAGDAVALDTLRISLKDSTIRSNTLDRFSGEAKSTFAEAAWAAISPILSGSFEEFVQSTQTLGDPVDVDDKLKKSWSLFTNQNAVDSIASEEIVIEMFAIDGQKRSLYEDGKRLIRTGYGGIATHINDDRYSDVASYNSRSLDVVEVRSLVKMKNKGKLFDAVVGVAMAWDPIKRRWQPVEFRVYHKKDAPVIVMPPM